MKALRQVLLKDQKSMKRSALNTAMKKRALMRVASAHLRKCAEETKKKTEAFKKIAPTYISKKSGKEILWATAYEDKEHPNHDQAVKDYQDWAEKNTGRGLVQKMISVRGKLGKALASVGKKLSAKSWSGVKAVAKQGKSEVAGMLVECPKILYSMAKGEYDFSDKEKLKSDLKKVWGSAVYYGGIAVAIMASPAAAGLLGTSSAVGVALGKSVATHAIIGAASSNADFWGFLSVEAAETVAGFAGKGSDLQESLGGFVSTDIFDGVVGAVTAGLKTIASDEDYSSEEDKFMVDFLGRVNIAIGQTMSGLSNEEMEKITQDAGLI